jgi:outer membrane protein TolC
MDEPQPVRTRTRNLKFIAPVLFLLLSLIAPRPASAQISLSTAVDLAEKSSPAVHAAQASVRKALAASQETRDAYAPNFVVGGSPGYFYGFPLGYPSLFNLQSSSLVLSFSQRDYMRSAHAALESANLNLKDTRQQIALDVSLDYVELDHDLREIAALDQEKGYAGTLVDIEQQRAGAGVDASIDVLRAQLTAAQVDEKRIHLENDADQMRQKLGHLTGLPADGLTTVSASIPPPPPLPSGASAAEPAGSDPGVAAAYANAKAKLFQSWGDARVNDRPLAVFGGQYSRFASFNNYSEFFRNFVYNNFGAGVQITLPLFDATRRARARESAADAVHALADADASRDTLSEQTQATRGSVRELAAQQRVAELQSRLAQEQVKAIDTELANGGGTGSQAVSPAEAQKAHIEERERYEDSLDADFSLIKVELTLLRLTGQLDSWIQSSLNSASP